jgi:hypothetical protein
MFEDAHLTAPALAGVVVVAMVTLAVFVTLEPEHTPSAPAGRSSGVGHRAHSVASPGGGKGGSHRASSAANRCSDLCVERREGCAAACVGTGCLASCGATAEHCFAACVPPERQAAIDCPRGMRCDPEAAELALAHLPKGLCWSGDVVEHCARRGRR